MNFRLSYLSLFPISNFVTLFQIDYKKLLDEKQIFSAHSLIVRKAFLLTTERIAIAYVTSYYSNYNQTTSFIYFEGDVILPDI